MENRFKFRCWDIENKKMMHNIQDLYDCPKTGFGCIGDIIDRPTQYIVMQSIGLTDKNVKLIFEKDIVKYYNNLYIIEFDELTCCYWLEPVKKTTIYIIEFDELTCCYWLEPVKKTTISVREQLTKFVASKCELIGNIYEFRLLDEQDIKVIGNIFLNKELIGE
jgi:uncharacterized phage protein (TIGR01671 family)